VQVLSNVAELELNNPALLRVLGHRLAQEGELDLAVATFEEVLKLRGEEPQSHRDLALVLAQRAGHRQDDLRRATLKGGARQKIEAGIRADYARSLRLLNEVAMRRWDRFEAIELIALMEANAILPRAEAAGLTDEDIPLDPRLIGLLACDIRIVLTWDADMTDMDLHVTEPSGEHVFYEHASSTIGGLLSRDFTDGYGPEEYLLRKAMHGVYRIEVDYFGSDAPTMLGAVTCQVDVFTNFGRPGERRQRIAVRLTKKEERRAVGEIEH